MTAVTSTIRLLDIRRHALVLMGTVFNYLFSGTQHGHAFGESLVSNTLRGVS